MVKKGPRVYFAHPKSAYFTDHEAAYLEVLANELPGWGVINPAGRYSTDAAWLRAWPRLVKSLDAVAVASDEFGTIGTGCLREITDAIAHGLPVLGLDLKRGLVELRGVELVEFEHRTRRHAAYLDLGRRRVNIAELVTQRAEVVA